MQFIPLLTNYVRNISINSLHVMLFVHIVQEPIFLSLSPDFLLRDLCQLAACLLHKGMHTVNPIITTNLGDRFCC
jgi:hypothetical protein